MNKFLSTIVVAPMTSTSKAYPTRIAVNHNQQTGWVVIDQIRTVDRQRIIKVLGELSAKEIAKVKEVIKETFVD
jgi:mRNA interferase MazF